MYTQKCLTFAENVPKHIGYVFPYYFPYYYNSGYRNGVSVFLSEKPEWHRIIFYSCIEKRRPPVKVRRPQQSAEQCTILKAMYGIR